MGLDERLIEMKVFDRCKFKLIGEEAKSLGQPRHLYKNKDYIVESVYIPHKDSMYILRSWDVGNRGNKNEESRS